MCDTTAACLTTSILLSHQIQLKIRKFKCWLHRSCQIQNKSEKHGRIKLFLCDGKMQIYFSYETKIRILSP